MIKALAGSALAVVVVFTGSALSPAAQASSKSDLLICTQFGDHHVDNGHFVLRNDNFGGMPECMSNVASGPNFSVSTSGAVHRDQGVKAFPNIFTGWSWGVSSKGTKLPARVSSTNPIVTWDTSTGSAKGRWDAGLDIWLGNTALTNGQATAGEIMVWDNTRRLPWPSGLPVVKVRGIKYILRGWRTRSQAGQSWPLIIFRRVHRRDHMHVYLKPFFKIAEKDHLIPRNPYLLNVEAGFEIWSRGRGLTTDFLSVRPRVR